MSTYYNKAADRAKTLDRRTARRIKSNLAEMGGNF